MDSSHTKPSLHTQPVRLGSACSYWGQRAHLPVPGSGAKCPSSHREQPVLPAALSCPAGQRRSDAAPSKQKLPAEHSKQPDAPALAQKPAAHTVHASDAPTEKVPPRQGRIPVRFGSGSWPDGASWHTTDPLAEY